MFRFYAVTQTARWVKTERKTWVSFKYKSTSMYENDLSLELISSISKMSVEEIERIINENEPVLA